MSTSATVSTPAPPPPSVAIRSKPPSPKRLSRKVLLAGVACAGVVIVTALMLGLSPQNHRARTEAEARVSASGPPETIAQASSAYDAAAMAGSDTAFALDAGQSDLRAPADPIWSDAAQSAPQGAASAPSSQPQQAARQDPLAAARASPILFGTSGAQAASGSVNERDAGEANLDATLIAPRSRYAIQAGNVIPAALVTELNSDLPGRVIAQVTAPVYDSVTGDHLLIPQGARLIGAYDNGVRYGDSRIVLVWNRLILPNGWSINLREMNASDPTGAAGLSDRTDNHWGRLSGAIGLSAIISVLANESEDDQQSNGSLSQSVGAAAAQQAAQTGSQVVQRELSVHPTLRVRPGASVRVLVMRDIAMRPYR